MSERTQAPESAGADDRCVSVHWSLPVQCVLKASHRENWHEAWRPETGNRLRYRYPGSLTEELHHGEWHRLDLPKPGAQQASDVEPITLAEFTALLSTPRGTLATLLLDGGLGDQVSITGVWNGANIRRVQHGRGDIVEALFGFPAGDVGLGPVREREPELFGAAPEPPLITTADQLRALPVGTVLLDDGVPAYPWQIRNLGAREDRHAESMCSDEWFYLGNDLNVAALLEFGPFRVLHTPVVPDGR